MGDEPNKVVALVVDDSDSERESLADLVRSEGFEVLEASSVSEARQHLDETSAIDVVLCDHVLPDGRGADLVRELEGNEPPRAILVTSSVEAPELRGRAFLAKPLRIPTLLSLLDAVKNEAQT